MQVAPNAKPSKLLENLSDYQAINAFLEDPNTHRQDERIEIVTTHGAKIFLTEELAYKIKLPVKYDNMDFSTLAKRRKVCLRELEINKPFAPQIYKQVLPITRQKDGTLEIDGEGTPVEWAIIMKRFPERLILRNLAEDGKLDQQIAARLGEQIASYHNSLQTVDTDDGAARILEIIQELDHEFQKLGNVLATNETLQYLDRARKEYDSVLAEMDLRAIKGLVRRCHGDLHLRNIVLFDGHPTLFDALEFDERLATIDVLYDLAFLVMDMLSLDMSVQANLVFNRYALIAWSLIEDSGFHLFPLFMSLRAAIRAMVAAQRSNLDTPAKFECTQQAKQYLNQAIKLLERRAPVLIAVGGYSGSGKSTLAAAIAPEIGMAPGAILIRSDLERKKMLSVGEWQRLPQSAYSAEITTIVYSKMYEKAGTALRQGYSVALDAVFSNVEERKAASELAEKMSVPFSGLWLDAPSGILVERVSERQHDASDATGDVVKRQFSKGGMPAFSVEKKWKKIDASGSEAATKKLAEKVLSTPLKL